jgi:hypothetical protein
MIPVVPVVLAKVLDMTLGVDTRRAVLDSPQKQAQDTSLNIYQPLKIQTLNFNLTTLKPPLSFNSRHVISVRLL